MRIRHRFVWQNTIFAPWQQVAQAESIASFLPAQFRGRIFAEAKLNSKERAIALTFDDGPWPKSTSDVLDILKQNQIKATFFMIGQNVQNYPHLAQQVAADGHAIGNHTWHHWYRPMDSSTAAHEVEDTTAIIYKTTEVKTSLFRPPGGILSNGPAEYAKKHKYGVVMWSDDSEDYRRPGVSVLVHNVLEQVHPDGIVLMHDGGGNRAQTVKALPKIIAELKRRGYNFVTVLELLALQDKEFKTA